MPLKDLLVRRIRAQGPMSIVEYMTLCLTHPEFGYYTARDPLGAGGDFTTAPEMSQMFGELLGLALAQHWIDTGQPEQVVLAELGPGRGTLMADALRATRSVPGFHDAIQLELVEVSTVLRERQIELLGAYEPIWRSGFADLSEGPLYLIANEFFDALPVRQFFRTDHGWSERVVGIDGDGDLTFGRTPAARIGQLEHLFDTTEVGAIVEFSAAQTALAGEVGARIARHGGTALIVDYGGTGGMANTFQAVKGHAKVDPLASPGTADLTAHVDFAALAAEMPPGAVAWPLIPQGVYLERLGIADRAAALSRHLSGPALDEHIAANRRLTHPDEMGALFKVLVITAGGAPVPPGVVP